MESTSWYFFWFNIAKSVRAMCRDGLRDFKVVARAIMHGSTWEWFEAEKNTCSSRCDQVFFHLTKKNADKLVYLQKKIQVGSEAGS